MQRFCGNLQSTLQRDCSRMKLDRDVIGVCLCLLCSKTGELLASRNDFKMNTCCIHPLGTLLLDMSHFKLLEESIKLLATQARLQQGNLFIISSNLSNLASQKINVNILS